MQPFSSELKEWCAKHPEFMKQLKLIYPDRFVSLFQIVISHPSVAPKDEVIGFWVLDYSRTDPLFKEDYTVDTGSARKEFHLYTGRKLGNGGKYVHNMNDFMQRYGNNGKDYAGSHHATYDELSPELKPSADRAMEIARVWKKVGVKNSTQEELQKISDKLDELGW